MCVGNEKLPEIKKVYLKSIRFFGEKYWTFTPPPTTYILLILDLDFSFLKDFQADMNRQQVTNIKLLSIEYWI